MEHMNGLDSKIMEMASRIRELREIVGMSVAEMAKRTDVSEDEYRECESGTHDLTFAFIYRAASALGVDVTDIIEGSSPKLRSYTVTRRGQGQRIEKAHGMVYYNLAPSFRRRIAEPLYVTCAYDAAAETKPPCETTVKPASAAEKPLPDTVPDTENLPAPKPKTPQEVEAERQQMLARLRTELRKQICAIHADVTLPPDREQGSGAAEQQLHILLYQTDVPESELNAALSDLRAQRRREKAQYQGAPFADVFQVELILSEEDSDRACIVDVGDTDMSYVIPWSSIPQELQQPLRRYVAQADGKLCGYCKEDLCNTENGRMIVELYLGKQEHHVSRILY